MHREVETHPSKPSLCPPLFTKQRLLHQPTAKLGVHSQGALPKTGSTWPCEASTTDAKTGRSACSRVCSQSRQGLCKPFWLVKSLNTVMLLSDPRAASFYHPGVVLAGHPARGGAESEEWIRSLHFSSNALFFGGGGRGDIQHNGKETHLRQGIARYNTANVCTYITLCFEREAESLWLLQDSSPWVQHLSVPVLRCPLPSPSPQSYTLSPT